MIENLFRTVINMSITASIIALLIIAIRITIGKYLPKNFSYYLWFIVLLRLIIPLNFSSSLSLFNFMPNTTTIISRVSSDVSAEFTQNNIQKMVVNNLNVPRTNITTPITLTSSLQIIVLGAAIIWILGMIFLIIRSFGKYRQAAKILETSTIARDYDISHIKKLMGINKNVDIYTLDFLGSPLVYGLIKPKIIIPASMINNNYSDDIRQILAHEIYHIKRYDNILKLIWSIVICIHWFNPLVWLSAKYFNEDMELSCDEKVMKIWRDDIRKKYANSLIDISDKQEHVMQGSLLFFGESNIKTRVKNIMKYKKPKAWITLFGIILLAVLIVFTLTNKQDKVIYRNENFGFTLLMKEKDFDKFKIFEESSGVYFCNKDVNEAYPEDMMGTVFRIEIYQKGRFTREDLEELNSIYNLKYIGENDEFYFGWAYPTDMQYSPNDERLAKSFKKTTKIAEKIMKSIEIIPPGSDKYAYNEYLKLAYEGKMDGIEFGIGDNTEEVVKKWGEPLEIDYFAGGLYLKYDNIVFFTNGYTDEGKIHHGEIQNMILFNNKDTYGIKSGMDIYAIEKILGQPNFREIYDAYFGPDPDGKYGEDNKAYYLAGNYMLVIPYNKDTKTCDFIELGRSEGYYNLSSDNFLELTDAEKKVYDKFIVDFNEEELRNLFPLSIMKLYFHAQKEKNYEAEWELYTKEENQLGWDKKEHMKIPERDRMKDFSPFENPVNIEINYYNDYKEAVISWEDKYLEEYDAAGNPFRYSFRLVLDKNYTWKVGFLPMQ